MRLTESSEQQALRKELRAYFADLLTPEVRRRLGQRGENAELFRELVKRLGDDGWLGIGWPTEYGGQGRPASDQFILFDEVQRAEAPFPFVTINTVGPTIMALGTEEQKARYLPGIVKGEINFAIGYSEPEAGTDLASLRTKAVKDGDQYVVNGNKVFTSGANQADYVWLACRTDPDAPKHKGISILIVPTSSPGFSWSIIETVADLVTTATYYDDVRVPVDALIGEEHNGWRLITSQLNHERVSLAAMGGLGERLWEDTLEWARSTRAIDEPWVQITMARARARLDAMRLLDWRMVGHVATGELGPGESSAVKVFGTEGMVEVCRLLLEVLGPNAVVRNDVERCARWCQVNTFGGGVNEVQREIVASAALGMARRAR